MFKRVYVEITNVCNLSCVFCPGTTRDKRFLTPEEFRLMAEKLRGHTRYLYFHVMGEPLLHPQLPELLAIAGELGFRVCITTNGTLLSKKGNALLAAPALHKVSVSLHSFEGNDGGDMADYLHSVWDFCRPRSIAAGRRGGAKRRNSPPFIHRQRSGCGKPARRQRGQQASCAGAFSGIGPEIRLAVPGRGGGQCAVLPRPAPAAGGAVRRHGGALLSGRRGPHGAGKPADAGAAGDPEYAKGAGHPGGLLPPRAQ